MSYLKALWKKLGALVVGASLALSGAAQTITYFHNDISGSPVVATDANGNVVWKEGYRPYGERLNNAPAGINNKLWFAGKPYDTATGLSYMGARYYDPMLGRFMGVDPVDYQEGNLHSFNRYAYANNNPYKFVDPDGRQATNLFPNFDPMQYLRDLALESIKFVGIAAGGEGSAAIEGAESLAVAIAAGRGASVTAKGVVQDTAKVSELIATHGKTMSNKQFNNLVKDIRINGIKEPLTVTSHEGKTYILDGHHRALAAPRAGVADVPVNRVELPHGAYKSPVDLIFTPGGY